MHCIVERYTLVAFPSYSAIPSRYSSGAVLMMSCSAVMTSLLMMLGLLNFLHFLSQAIFLDLDPIQCSGHTTAVECG